MKQISTNQELVNILTDLEKQGPAFYLFNRAKIQQFTKENAIRIGRVKQKSVELAEKFGVKDENDELIIDKETQSITFATEDDRAEFTLQWNFFMEQTIELIV